MNSSTLSGRFRLTLLLAVVCVGCQLLQVTPTRPTITEVIDSLYSSDPAERKAAAEMLEALTAEGLTVEEGIAALTAATADFPPHPDEWQDSAIALIQAAAQDPRSEYSAVIADLFPSYSDRAKQQVLLLLSRITDRQAATTYMDLVRTFARSLAEDHSSDWRYEWPLPNDCRHEDVFFPELFEYIDIPTLEYPIYLFCLRCFQDEVLTITDLPNADIILEAYRGYKEQLIPAQRSDGVDWIWEDEYQIWRGTASVILDLFGYMPTLAVKLELREALSYQDPRLVHFAVVSLLRLGEEVSSEFIHLVASSPEMRSWLYYNLVALDLQDLFPEEFRTQEAFAESEMVDWLVYPTELGRAPHEIELMQIVTRESGTSDNPLKYYVFRFRTLPPHWAAEDGWMAGIAGPFLGDALGDFGSHGHTFSQFEPWDSMNAEDHVDHILELFARWEVASDP